MASTFPLLSQQLVRPHLVFLVSAHVQQWHLEPLTSMQAGHQICQAKAIAELQAHFVYLNMSIGYISLARKHGPKITIAMIWCGWKYIQWNSRTICIVADRIDDGKSGPGQTWQRANHESNGHSYDAYSHLLGWNPLLWQFGIYVSPGEAAFSTISAPRSLQVHLVHARSWLAHDMVNCHAHFAVNSYKLSEYWSTDFWRGCCPQIAFIQVLKVATPLFTLGISAVIGLDSITRAKCLAVTFILLGSCIATFVESNSVGFSWFGLQIMIFSALLEAIKVVYIQKLLGSLDLTSVEMVVYLGPPTAILLGSASWLLEGQGLKEYGVSRMQRRPLFYLAALLGGFGVNLSTAFAIQASSSLTFKVWGCMKNTAVVIFGCLMGDVLDRWQVLGYVVSTLGFLLYTWTKLLREPQLHQTKLD